MKNEKEKESELANTSASFMSLNMINSYASTDFESTEGNGLLGFMQEMQAPASLDFDSMSQNRGFAGSESEGKLG
ncbi:hypothetical protein SADUNF_Sadunf12G0014700 [Salix dunnii]|uniref:Uncharacterized protein n=1 Tax=Salix dunnii TaxID=1413687 RepID=A0A835MLL2_9ROSI|nr:hypothetical protein SADUNF_Sadunf12G0014700 [Salix dunnii]